MSMGPVGPELVIQLRSRTELVPAQQVIARGQRACGELHAPHLDAAPRRRAGLASARARRPHGPVARAEDRSAGSRRRPPAPRATAARRAPRTARERERTSGRSGTAARQGSRTSRSRRPSTGSASAPRSARSAWRPRRPAPLPGVPPKEAAPVIVSETTYSTRTARSTPRRCTKDKSSTRWSNSFTVPARPSGLSADRQRQRPCGDERHEISPSHSITSSARARSVFTRSSGRVLDPSLLCCCVTARP